jgi:hypothetical protein
MCTLHGRLLIAARLATPHDRISGEAAPWTTMPQSAADARPGPREASRAVRQFAEAVWAPSEVVD